MVSSLRGRLKGSGLSVPEGPKDPTDRYAGLVWEYNYMITKQLEP